MSGTLSLRVNRAAGQPFALPKYGAEAAPPAAA
jgi:hypothetical protein